MMVPSPSWFRARRRVGFLFAALVAGADEAARTDRKSTVDTVDRRRWTEAGGARRGAQPAARPLARPCVKY